MTERIKAFLTSLHLHGLGTHGTHGTHVAPSIANLNVDELIFPVSLSLCAAGEMVRCVDVTQEGAATTFPGLLHKSDSLLKLHKLKFLTNGLTNNFHKNERV